MDDASNKLEIILDKIENLEEKFEISKETRTILDIFQDIPNNTERKTIDVSLFDEFNNESLLNTIDEIRNTCVRMGVTYRFALERICRIKTSAYSQQSVNFI